jgi:hypothetical protein
MKLSAIILLTTAVTAVAATHVTFDANGVCEIDGAKTFVLSFALPPPADGKTPEGKNAWQELEDAGATFARIAPQKWPTEEEQGSPAAMARLKNWLDAAAAHHLHCWITLGDLPALKANDPAKEQTLRRIVTAFKDHPGLGGWKGADEPAWVKVPADRVARAYALFKQLDPNHPVIIIQAPTRASLPFGPYMQACDVTGVDIYPLAYPPGKHSDFGNREMSIVSDTTQWIRAAAHGKPVWMTLQIAWGGVASAGKTLRFPTFEQSRYMAYAAIINGARGINYQGGALPTTLNERDTKLGWNWTFWQRVMRPLVEELGVHSPLYPALLAPDAKLAIKLQGASDIEFITRQVGSEIFLLAARREGETGKVAFSGLPVEDATYQLLYEEPRNVTIKDGAFEEWFAPNEVHVYRFRRSSGR